MSGFTTLPQTRFGLHLYAVGGNPDAARRAGIRVDRLKMVAFMFAGALAALGGILAASRGLGGASPSGRGTILPAGSAAAVLVGSLLGALCIGSLAKGL